MISSRPDGGEDIALFHGSGHSAPSDDLVRDTEDPSLLLRMTGEGTPDDVDTGDEVDTGDGTVTGDGMHTVR
jgi:hypothetical protein